MLTFRAGLATEICLHQSARMTIPVLACFLSAPALTHGGVNEMFEASQVHVLYRSHLFNPDLMPCLTAGQAHTSVCLERHTGELWRASMKKQSQNKHDELSAMLNFRERCLHVLPFLHLNPQLRVPVQQSC